MPPADDTRHGPGGYDDDDHRLAADLATEVGVELVELRERSHLDPALRNPHALGAAADKLAHKILADALGEARPDDALLSEEAYDDHSRLGRRRVWIVDPLDGTWHYQKAGRTDWAVHVGLAVDGAPVVGAVALPAEGITLSTAEPPPMPAAGGAGTRLRVVASLNRPPPHAKAVAKALDAELIQLGSVGAKAGAVILGRANIYVHSGGQSEWDSAAPVAVALATGLHATRLDGRELRYNRPDTYVPDLLICRPELAEAVIAAAAAYDPRS